MKKDGSNDRLYKIVKALNEICKKMFKYEEENWVDVAIQFVVLNNYWYAVTLNIRICRLYHGISRKCEVEDIILG